MGDGFSTLRPNVERFALLVPALALVATAGISRTLATRVARDVSPAPAVAYAAQTPATSAGSRTSPIPHPPSLKVCADPNNLPFSNRRLEGFENRLAELLAAELGASGVEYTWWAQRRGFFRNTLNARLCDVVLGVPAGFDMALTTAPYYRSSYAFVARADRRLRVRTFDDPALRRLKVGVQLVGDDGMNTPPAHALSRRGIVGNLVGYSVVGDYREENPPARIVDAVAAGDVDVAVVWGPLAGYFATREPVPLTVVPVTPQLDPPALPLAFDIAVAVRKGDVQLRDRIDAALRRRRADVERILDEYGVPRVPRVPPLSAGRRP